MITELLEARIAQLEDRVKDVERIINHPHENQALPVPAQRGWRAFVGVDANNPDFAEAECFGRAWRFADSPDHEVEER